MDGLRRALEDDGFAVLPGLLGGDEVELLAAAFERLVALARALPESGPVGDAWFVLDPDPFRLRRVVWCGGADVTLASYGADPRFLALARSALGVSAFDQIIQQAHFKLPGDGVAFGWHQDASNRRYGTDAWRDIDGRGSFVQIAVAIDAQGPENGGLVFLAGSHRRGFVADPVTGVIPAGLLEGARQVEPRLAPGDAVVFGPFVIHGSAPNPGPGSRRLLLQGYALPGANGRIYPGCGLGVPRRHPG